MFYKKILDFDFSKLDYFLISLFMLLGFIGLLVLTTASLHFSDSLYDNPTHILNKQLFQHKLRTQSIHRLVFSRYHFYEIQKLIRTSP